MVARKAQEALIIGVGSVGCRLAAGVGERLPDHRYLFIDTDRYSLQAYPQEQILLIG